MSLSFTCTHCSREYQVAESLAGKKARCKGCGAELRVPLPEAKAVRPSRPASKPPEDRFGFDDAPPVKVPLYTIEDDPVLPPRAPASWKPSKKREGRAARDNLHEVANRCCFGGFWCWFGGLALIIALSLGISIPDDGQGLFRKLQLVAGGLICLLGTLGMAVALVIAIVNLIRFGEVPRVGIGGALVWIVTVLLVPWSLYTMVGEGIKASRVAMARQNGLVAGPGVAPAIATPPGFPPMPPVGPPRVEVRVVLGEGEVRRRVGPNGVTLPGVDIRVNYSIETGQAMGEKYVLMIGNAQRDQRQRVDRRRPVRGVDGARIVHRPEQSEGRRQDHPPGDRAAGSRTNEEHRAQWFRPAPRQSTRDAAQLPRSDGTGTPLTARCQGPALSQKVLTDGLSVNFPLNDQWVRKNGRWSMSENDRGSHRIRFSIINH
jgi:hypothetical protein